MAIYKLGEIGELKYSKSFVANGNDSDFPIFATGGIVGYTKIPTFESNSIILPRVGTMSIYFTNKKHSTKNTAFSFKTKDDTTTKYIYYLMSSIDFSIFSMGSAVPRLTSNFWNQYFINLPPLEEQQKIIDIIEQKNELFLKFPNTIRIDTFEHIKNDLKNLIDIIEPVENLLKQINNLRNKLLIFILNLPFNDKKEKIFHFLEPIKNKPKHIKQISAKVLSNQGTISNLENIDTYKTNNFFTPKGSFVFCSIRTYLKKWGLVPYSVDSNGTLFQFSIKNNITSLISFLMNNDSWEKFNLLSSGTKMPVIKKESFLNVELPLKTIEIHKIDQILISFNQLELKTNLLKEKLIQLLLK